MDGKTTTLSTTGQCRHIKSDGNHCRANARRGSTCCFFHDPDSVNEREAARISGGKERSRKAAVLPGDTPNRSLASASDVTGLLAETINQVRRGEIDPRISNAVGYLAGILLKAKQQDELEQRLAQLESTLIRQRASSNATLDPVSDSESFEFANPVSGAQA